MRKGEFIFTHTGTKFYPLDPRPEEIHVEDIAHSLAMQCRYTGHISKFYSIAEHSVHVASVVPPALTLVGLLHDASEAYLVDVPRPVKHSGEFGRLYQEIEAKLMIAVGARFGIHPDLFDHPEIKEADKGMIWVESRIMMPADPVWEKYRTSIVDRDPPFIQNWEPGIGEQHFLRMFDKLTHGTRNLTA